MMISKNNKFIFRIKKLKLDSFATFSSGIVNQAQCRLTWRQLTPWFSTVFCIKISNIRITIIK